MPSIYSNILWRGDRLPKELNLFHLSWRNFLNFEIGIWIVQQHFKSCIQLHREGILFRCSIVWTFTWSAGLDSVWWILFLLRVVEFIFVSEICKFIYWPNVVACTVCFDYIKDQLRMNWLLFFQAVCRLST